MTNDNVVDILIKEYAATYILIPITFIILELITSSYKIYGILIFSTEEGKKYIIKLWLMRLICQYLKTVVL